MAQQHEPLAALIQLHQEIDSKTTLLVKHHGSKILCQKGCHNCCRDDLTIFAIEALRIRTHCHDFLRTQSPHPPGACAFLDPEGACRIYEHRPYVCRTQGLPLRWVEEENGEWVEYRDICPLEEDQIAPENLTGEECWTLGDIEGKLAELQGRLKSGRGTRVSMRSLFGVSAGTWEV